MKKKVKVFLAIPTIQNIIDSQVHMLREITEHYAEHVELVYPKACIRRMFHDFARNMLVEEFLDSDCDILWFLDSDITPCKYILDLVVLHGDTWKIAGAPYPVLMTPNGLEAPELVFTLYRKDEKTGSLKPGAVPMEGQEFVDGLATGCLFIKREVFSLMKRPFFEFKYKKENMDLIEGEDLGFVLKANALGIRYFTDYSFTCKHQKSVDLLDINNYAITYSNRNVMMALDNQKKTYEELARQAYRAGHKRACDEFQEKVRQRQFLIHPKPMGVI